MPASPAVGVRRPQARLSSIHPAAQRWSFILLPRARPRPRSLAQQARSRALLFRFQQWDLDEIIVAERRILKSATVFVLAVGADAVEPKAVFGPLVTKLGAGVGISRQLGEIRRFELLQSLGILAFVTAVSGQGT